MMPLTDDPPCWIEQAYQLGRKIASDEVMLGDGPDQGRVEVAYNLSGRLQAVRCEQRDWIALGVPAAIVRGVFDAMTEPGIELPLDDAGRLEARIAVFYPDEVKLQGGPDAFLNDRGKPFTYTLGRLVSFQPEDWTKIDRAWAIRVHSAELQQLRRSYGMSSLPGEGRHDFSIVVAIRRRGVLGRNESAKRTDAA